MSKSSWLDRVRHLRLVVKRAVATLQAGSLQSIFKGSGLAFEEVRPYQPGDDVRAIDWNVTARLGQPFVKRFVEERELRIYFVLDLSGSQMSGSSHLNKRDVAAEVIALLSLAGLRQGDSLGLITFTSGIQKYLPPRRGVRHALRLIYESLYADPKQSGTDLGKALQFISRITRRRSVVVLLSDFLDRNWQGSLDRLAHRHDVYAIRTHAPLDEELPEAGLLALNDLETGQVRFVDSSQARMSSAGITLDQQKKRKQLHWIPLGTQGNHVPQLLSALRQLRRFTR
ncbi:MAG TPA: DUF58 domain-containing protein [Gemmatales bacterium]|nr:DUF58 domain-containing protein [Gemmatales bacterium]